MDEGRPVALVVAVVSLGLLGLGALLAAPVMAAEAASASARDDHLGAIGGAVLLAGAGLSVVVGVLALAAAVGLWRRLAWGWVMAVATTTLVITGALAALAGGAVDRGIVMGLVLGVIGAASTWAPGTRGACDR